jgi:hypothetical protein
MQCGSDPRQAGKAGNGAERDVGRLVGEVQPLAPTKDGVGELPNWRVVID